MSGMSIAACIIWTLTATPADDVLRWDAHDFATLVTWQGDTLVVVPGVTEAFIGPEFTGVVTVRAWDVVSGRESVPRMFWWDADVGRRMEWTRPCPLGAGARGNCVRTGRQGRCIERAVVCRPACGEE